MDRNAEISTRESLFLCALYIMFSTALVQYNARLVLESAFKHYMVLAAFQMATTFVVTCTLYFLKPSLFPAMNQLEGIRIKLFAWFVPLGLLFASGLFFQYHAVLVSNPSFLQFIKETNCVIVFCLSCLVGLTSMTGPKLGNLFIIVVGACIAVGGETTFLYVGLACQLTSQFSEGGKIVLGEWLMKGGHIKLDPMTYLLFIAPACLAALVACCVLFSHPDAAQDFLLWWPYLIPTAFLAFALNVVTAVLVQRCSAMAFVLSDLVKDTAIVITTHFVFGGHVEPQQFIGFLICLLGTFFWAYSRVAPDAWLVRCFEEMWGEDPVVEQGETCKLLMEKTHCVQGLKDTPSGRGSPVNSLKDSQVSSKLASRPHSVTNSRANSVPPSREEKV